MLLHSLFVYGSLLDNENEFSIYLKNNSTFYSDGKFKGRLYNIGEYPGAVLMLYGNDFVYGKIFMLHEHGETLKQLDYYEGFDQDNPLSNEFIRESVEIETESGTVKCWVYLYNFEVGSLPQIKTGKYF